MAGDANFDKVSLLLHMDGADGSTAFTDKSSATKTVTANGNARISTAQGLWGGASGYFDGNGDYLALPSSAAFGFGLDDFTIEAFIYISGAQGTDRGITDFRATDGSDVGTFFIDGKAGNRLDFWHGAKLGATGTALEQNTWYHVVLCRGTGVMRCFLNGVLQWSSSSAVDFCNSRPLGIAGSVMTMALGAGSSPFFGHMRELRITKGVARYTANFSPPTEPFPNASAAYALSGTVTGSTVSPVARAIRAQREDTGAYVGGAISDGVTGAFTINTSHPGEHTVVAYPVTGENLPALVHHGVIPI